MWFATTPATGTNTGTRWTYGPRQSRSQPDGRIPARPDPWEVGQSFDDFARFAPRTGPQRIAVARQGKALAIDSPPSQARRQKKARLLRRRAAYCRAGNAIQRLPNGE